MPTSSQQTNIQRAIGDVKSIFCKINEDFCQLKFHFVNKVCVFSFFFFFFLFYLFRAVLKLGHWKVNAEIDSKSVPPYLLK